MVAIARFRDNSHSTRPRDQFAKIKEFSEFAKFAGKNTRPDVLHQTTNNMQLMTFNSLLMFDIVFIFFLFLIGVTCLVYYLPPKAKRHKSPRKTKQDLRNCMYCDKCKLIYQEVYCTPATEEPAPATSSSLTSQSYLKAKHCDTKNCKGPIFEV